MNGSLLRTTYYSELLIINIDTSNKNDMFTERIYHDGITTRIQNERI